MIETDPPHQFFLDDCKLSLQALHDSELDSLYTKKKLLDRPGSKWLAIDDNIAVIRMEPHTDDTSVVVHVYISTEFQQQGILKYVVVDVINYLLENTEYKKIVVPIPSPCKHVIRTMKPLGFKYAGKLSKKLIWRNEPVDLIYYTRKVT